MWPRDAFHTRRSRWTCVPQAYLMRLGPQVYVDARECMDVLARFINDCRNPVKHNVTFVKQPEV